MNDWQVDKDGRRFRMIGESCREYEGDILTTVGTFSEGHVPKIVRTETSVPVEQVRFCPFTSMRNDCRKNCVFRACDGCGIGRGIEAKEGLCPFTRISCTKDCALYHDGCVLRKGN